MSAGDGAAVFKEDPPDLNAGVPHAPGRETVEVAVQHPSSGETVRIHVPADHDGSRIKVEFPDGEVAWTPGWDPAERAVAAGWPAACASCGEQQYVSGSFVCDACGAANRMEVVAVADGDVGQVLTGE